MQSLLRQSCPLYANARRIVNGWREFIGIGRLAILCLAAVCASSLDANPYGPASRRTARAASPEGTVHALRRANDARLRLGQSPASARLRLGQSPAGTGGDLLGRVPADCPVVVEVRNLEGALDDLLESPFYNKLKTQRLFAEMADWDIVRRYRAWANGFATETGVDLGATFNNLFGRQVVIAAWPDGDVLQGVFLCRFPDTATLDRMMTVFDAISRKNGTLTTSHYKGRTIRYRDIPEGNNKLRSDYYVQLGNCLAVALHKELLHRVIDTAQTGANARTLAGVDRFAATRRRAFNNKNTLALAWIDTRTLGKQKAIPFVAPLRRHDNPITAALGRELHTLMAGFDRLAVTVTRDHGLRIAIDAPLRDDREATPLDFLFIQPNAEGVTHASLPANPTAIVQWQTDLPRLNRAVGRFFPKTYEERIRLVRTLVSAALGGGDLNNGILANLGPDLSLVAWGEARPVGKRGRLEGLAVPKLSILMQNRGRREFASRVDPLLRRYMMLLTLVSAGGGGDDNRASFYLDLHRGVSVGQVRMLGHSNPLGKRLWPSWAFVDNVFAVGTLKGAVTDVIDRRRTKAPPALPTPLAELPPHSGLIYADAARLAAWLRANAPYMARRDTRDTPAAFDERSAVLNERIDTLTLFEHLLFVRRRTGDGLRWTLEIRTRHPLRRTP